MTKVREDNLSYIVQVGNRLIVRSRKMLKLANSEPVTLHRKTTEFFSHFQHSYSSQYLLNPSHQLHQSANTSSTHPPQQPHQPANTSSTNLFQQPHQPANISSTHPSQQQHPTAINMGGWFSSEPEVQAEKAITQTGNTAIQLNWATFSTGILSLAIILVLLILLAICYKKNR